jgi:hypothetical protein
MTLPNWSKLGLLCLFAFAGGFAAQFAIAVTPSLAQSNSASRPVFMYGEDGKQRLQFGIYTGAGERGLPLIGLSDNQGRLRMLFRLAGGNESPVIVMKDTSGQDRLVMGLDLNDGNQAPFLSIVDGQGRKQNVFGQY